MVQNNSPDSVSLIAPRPCPECMIAGYATDLLTNSYRPGDLVTSDSGKHMQRGVWKEIAESLAAKLPEVSHLTSLSV